MSGGAEIILRFEGLLSEIGQLSEDIAEEIGKFPSERSADMLEKFKVRSNTLKHAVSAAVHGAMAASVSVGRAEDGLAQAADPAELRSLRNIVSQGMYLRSRFDQIMNGLEYQMTRPPLPLYDDAPLADKTSDSLIRMMDQALTMMDSVINPVAQGDAAYDLGCFPDIRLKPQEFMAHALAAYRVMLAAGYYNKARFLDVGCGGGGKVMMASQFFARADGIEIDPGYAEAARQLVANCDLPSSEIFEENAIEFEGYENYEVVYFYQPMRATEGLLELERQIVSRVRPGTVLIAPYLNFRTRSEKLGFRHLDGHLFIAGADEDMIDQIRSAAETTGVTVRRDLVVNPWGEVWHPAMHAFAANGFGV